MSRCHRPIEIVSDSECHKFSTSVSDQKSVANKLRLHGAIYRPDSFVLVLRNCANLKAIRCKLTSLNRMVADKSYRVIVA